MTPRSNLCSSQPAYVPGVGEVNEAVVDVALFVPMGAQPRESLLVYERLQPAC